MLSVILLFIKHTTQIPESGKESDCTVVPAVVFSCKSAQFLFVFSGRDLTVKRICGRLHILVKFCRVAPRSADARRVSADIRRFFCFGRNCSAMTKRSSGNMVKVKRRRLCVEWCYCPPCHLCGAKMQLSPKPAICAFLPAFWSECCKITAKSHTQFLMV